MSTELRKIHFLFGWCPLAAALALGAIPAAAQTCSFSSPTVTCTGLAGGGVSGVGTGGATSTWSSFSGSPYTYNVTGTGTATVTKVALTLHGISANGAQSTVGACLSDAGFLLVAPGGQKFYFMNQAGYVQCTNANGGTGSNISGLTLNIADANTTAMYGPTPPNSYWPSGTTLSLAPGSYNGQTLIQSMSGFPGDIAGSGDESTPDGIFTFNTTGSGSTGVFNGATALGNWTLYAADQPYFAVDTVNFTSWDLTLTVSATDVMTTTSVTSNATSPVVTGSAVTYTATVSSTGGTPTGTVQFTDTIGGVESTLSGCGAQPVSNGVATCPTVITAEGNHLISGSFTGTGIFLDGSGSISPVYRRATTGTSPQFCNSGSAGSYPITGDPTTQAIYPSYINVSGLPSSSVATLTIQLSGLTGNGSANEGLQATQMMLVAPSGQALEFLSDVAQGAPQPSVNITLADSSTLAMPATGTLTSTTYSGTSYTPEAATYPAPAPTSFSVSPPDGASTIELAFSGATANGNWLLYARANGTTEAAALSGWCITLTQNSGTNTTTTLTPNPNPATLAASVGFSAAVTSTATVNAGTVTFTENGASVAGGPTGPVAVSGTPATASFNTTTLSEGDHKVTASYSGASGLNPSFGTAVERVDKATTESGAGPYMYCNTGAITIPANQNPPTDFGAATPNPSNIFVTNLPGTISAVSLALNQLLVPTSAPTSISTLLVGPAATGAQSFDLFSVTNILTFNSGNLTLSDTGSSLVPNGGSIAAGTYKPTSYTSNDMFTASTSGFYTLPASGYQYASTSGAVTFAGLYGGLVGDGTWSLYFNQTSDGTGSGVSGGWCLSFTEHPVTGTGTSRNSPTDFTQGGTGAVTFSLENNGVAVTNLGSTGDPAGTNPMTITGTLPSAFTLGTLPTGTPWNCTAVTLTVTCKSDSVVAAGSSYPLLSIPVSVASGAPASASVSGFTFSGAGMTGGSFPTNTITIQPAPFIGVSKSPSGTFTQGQSAVWDIQVFNTIANSTTSGTLNVVDTLPANYSLVSYTGTGWMCGASGVTVTCSSTTAVAGGSSYPTIALTVGVPAASPVSVTNNVVAYGGGSLTQGTSVNGATAFSTVTVVQVPATMTANASTTPQTATVRMAFNALGVTVKDANGVGVQGVSVTFAAPSSGASGTFAGNTTTKVVTTNASGIASVAFTANSIPGGPYTVTAASAGLTTVNFSLTNVAGLATHFSVTAPGTATPGVAFNFSVTALDANNNTSTGYSGTVRFTSTDPAGIMPASSTLSLGTGVFSATLVTSGNQTITATDTVTSSIMGTSGNINVSGGYMNVTSSLSISTVGPIYNRVTKLYYVTVTVTNTGASTISGPIELVFGNLPSTVTLSNSAGTAPGGNPYMSIASSLAPGSSASVQAQFSETSNTQIPISITAYSGAF